MIGKIIGLGGAAREMGAAVGNVAEVFVGNRAERDAADLERFNRSLAQFGEEFARPGGGRFDGFVDGLNRLPRPMMALGTLGLFTYSMLDPSGFAARMQGLAYIPEPLWWLLGAVVSFYFGARELHHYRGRKLELPTPPQPRAKAVVEARPAAAAPAGSPATSAPVPATAAPKLNARARADIASPPPLPAPAASPSVTEPSYNAAFEEWRAPRA